MKKQRREAKINTKRFKKNEGITLIALVITIIVLLILAGVSLSMVLSQDGIFSRAEKATDKYGQSKARETLELVLGEAQMQKYEQGLTDLQLDNKINEIGELLPKEKTDPNLQNVIVDGSIFEIDRSVPKIVDYIGPADGVVITAQINGNKNGWFKEGEKVNISVTGTIKTYSGGNITTVSATKGGVAISDFSIDGEGKYTITGITEDTIIVIYAKDSNNKENTRPIPITIKIDNIKPTVSEIDTAGSVGLIIKFKATATDNESGLKEGTPLYYTITPTTGLTTSSGDFASGETIVLTTTEEKIYTITVTATDKAGNISSEKTATLTTVDGGVLKHIKTTEGLKEVNTKDIYGANVLGYNCTRTGVEWQIFYIDEEDDNRVYLIAKDYMAPPTTNTELTRYDETRYPKAYYFNTIVLNKFKTTIPNTPFTTKFLSDYAGTSATSQENYQETNYMLDQTIWSEYMSTNGKSDYAFGGPTLPLFQASYNDICKTATKLGIQKSGTGYQINQGGGSWSTTISGYGSTTTQNGIYFYGASSGSAVGMWLASPSSSGPSYQMITRYVGEVRGYHYGGTNGYYAIGYRPVVSLKSSVTFTTNADGSYTIN